jgi:F-type H+-transporting ATPase subunit a
MESPEKIFNLHLGNIDISVGNSAFWMITATAALAILFYTFRQYSIRPNKTQNIFEVIYEFIEKEIVVTVGLGKEWLSFLFALFLFILSNNYLGLIPGIHTPTSKITVTATLALIVFFSVHFVGFRQKGFFGYLKSILPAGVSGPVLILLFPLEIVSQLLRPFSLAIRLFANLTAGHLLILSFLGFNLIFRSFFVYPLGLAGAIVISLFEIFVGFIQAYIFTFLSALYIKEAVSESH